MNIYVSFLNIILIYFLTIKFIILPILCFIFALSIVTNNAFINFMTVQIYVFLYSSAMVQYRYSFARFLDWDSSLTFPYEDTIRVLRCIFGNNFIIQIINFLF